MVPTLILDKAETEFGKSIPLDSDIDLRLPAKEAWEASEHSLQKEFFRYISTKLAEFPLLFLAHAIPNGGKRSKPEAARLVAEGVKGGVPDVFIPIPQEFAGLYIEFKKAGGSPSLDQRYFLMTLKSLGYKCAVVNDLDTAKRILHEYLKI